MVGKPLALNSEARSADHSGGVAQLTPVLAPRLWRNVETVTDAGIYVGEDLVAYGRYLKKICHLWCTFTIGMFMNILCI